MPQQPMNIVYFLLIGLAAGWLAGRLVRRRGFGVAGNLLIGVIGAVLGGFLFGLLGVRAYDLLGSLVLATVGAVVLLVIVNAVNRNGRA